MLLRRHRRLRNQSLRRKTKLDFLSLFHPCLPSVIYRHLRRQKYLAYITLVLPLAIRTPHSNVIARITLILVLQPCTALYFMNTYHDIHSGYVDKRWCWVPRPMYY